MQKILIGLLLVTGCSGKPEATDDFSDLASQDVKSDYFSSRLKLLGEATDGATVRYTKSPSFRGWSFNAPAGATVDAWVRSSTGDAVAWLLTANFRVIAKNDDADDSTFDSHLATTLKAGGKYYLVFRDYEYASRTFRLGFALKTPQPTNYYPPAAPDGPVRRAFLAEWNVKTWQAHPAIALDKLPVAARERADQFHSFAGQPTRIWKLASGFAQITAWEDNRYFVDLYDGAGRWVDHGYDDNHGGTQWEWSYNDGDPTICNCQLVGVFDDGHICVWMDGSTNGASAFDCD